MNETNDETTTKINDVSKTNVVIVFLKIITTKNLLFNDSKNDITENDDVTKKNDDEIAIVFRNIESIACIVFLMKNFVNDVDFC